MKLLVVVYIPQVADMFSSCQGIMEYLGKVNIHFVEGGEILQIEILKVNIHFVKGSEF